MQMRNWNRMRMIVTVSAFFAACAIFMFACGPTEKTAPLPPSNLEERGAALAEVQTQLAALETADAVQAGELLRHADHRVRIAAAERLAEDRNVPTEVVEALVAAAEDKNALVRIAALRGLTGVDDERAVDAVIRAMADSDAKVRKWAYKGLKKLEKKAVPAMIRHVVTKSNIAALSYKTPTNQTETLSDVLLSTLSEMGKAAVPYLAELLKDPETGPSLKAISVLGKIGPNAGDAVPLLLRIIDSTTDTAIKKNAIDAIANIGDMDPEVMPKLLELSEDSNSVISGAAKQALKKLEEDT